MKLILTAPYFVLIRSHVRDDKIPKVLQLIMIINIKHAIECSIANNSCLHHIMDGLTIIDKTFGLIILFKMLIALQQLD